MLLASTPSVALRAIADRGGTSGWGEGEDRTRSPGLIADGSTRSPTPIWAARVSACSPPRLVW